MGQWWKKNVRHQVKRGRGQNLDPRSMDHLFGPGPWTPYLDRVHGPPIWTGSMDPLFGPGAWTPYLDRVHGPPLWTGSMDPPYLDRVHGPPIWTGCMDPLFGPGPWTPYFLSLKKWKKEEEGTPRISHRCCFHSENIDSIIKVTGQLHDSH